MLNLNQKKPEREWKTKIRTKNKGKNRKNFKNMVDINPTISIITLTINGLNAPIKRDVKNKNDPTIFCL